MANSTKPQDIDIEAYEKKLNAGMKFMDVIMKQSGGDIDEVKKLLPQMLIPDELQVNTASDAKAMMIQKKVEGIKAFITACVHADSVGINETGMCYVKTEIKNNFPYREDLALVLGEDGFSSISYNPSNREGFEIMTISWK